MDPGAGQRRLDAAVPQEDRPHAVERVREEGRRWQARELLGIGAGGPRGQQGRPHGQRGPHRRKRCRGVVKEGAVAIAVVLELLPEGGAKAQQHFDHRPGREMVQRGALGREWRRKAHRTRRPRWTLQDAERERNDRALRPRGERSPMPGALDLHAPALPPHVVHHRL